MTPADEPLVVAFDGSAESEAAVRAAAKLCGPRRLVVVSVWEPGLAMAMAMANDPTGGVGYMPPGGDDIVAVDRAQRDHAADVAAAGARLAGELGAPAEPYPIADEVDVATTVADVADQLDAVAIVVGSRGLGGVKSRLLGSTSNGLLHRTRRPVVVVRAPD